jgi:hypothetical protein
MEGVLKRLHSGTEEREFGDRGSAGLGYVWICHRILESFFEYANFDALERQLSYREMLSNLFAVFDGARWHIVRLAVIDAVGAGYYL